MMTEDLQKLIDGGGLTDEAMATIKEILNNREKEGNGGQVDQAEIDLFEAATNEADTCLKRYNDGYFVSEAVTRAGGLVKGLGIALAVIVIAGGFLCVYLGLNIITLIGFVLLGVVNGIVLYFIGVLISALGQILKASFDTAVHTSPFLTEKQKASVMALS